MPLPGYGLLIGKITASRPRRHGSPHWLLMVEPGLANHPAYRVGVNLQPKEAEPKDAARKAAAQKEAKRKEPYPKEVIGRSRLQYQIVDFEQRATRAGKTLVQALTNLGITKSFMPAISTPSLPRLDFVRGGILDPTKFEELAGSPDSLCDEFERTVALAMTSKGKTAPLVAVFGTGYPIDAETGAMVPTGFTGIDNIHMNQGALNLINDKPYYRENGANQDGGLIFLLPTGAKGFFVKFSTQLINTDANGNPTITGISALDDISPEICKAIMPRRSRRIIAARVSTASMTTPVRGGSPTETTPSHIPQSSGTTNARHYFFADFDPDDASGQYIPDDDANTYKTPYVITRSKGHTHGPVPTPRGYPRLDLETIVGTNPPGYVKDSQSERIAFDVIGDSGAPSQRSLDAFELKVTDLISRDAKTSPPAFLFHVGDVVYFYGEENYYYSQFYEPFRAYPAPIFAIPGNHDGITYNDSMVSLDSFQKAFCAEKPGRWEGSGGILRSAMTQPGVYFTLDTPLVSIIGLYSNCGESFGWLNGDQLKFLYQELIRLKKLRSKGLPAVILAIHHFPRWFPAQKPKDPMSTDIDATCKKAGFWPDAVICGHAHLYQRVVRQDIGQDVPYVLSGAGGYGISGLEEVGKSFMKQIASSGNRLSRILLEYGYVRATVTRPASGDATLRFEYHSVKQTSNEPDDVCTVNLRTNKLV